MNRTLRFVLPLTMLALLLCPHRAPAPIIYRDGEGLSSSDLSDIEIKKNAEEQFKLAERYEAAGRLQACGRLLPARGEAIPTIRHRGGSPVQIRANARERRQIAARLQRISDLGAEDIPGAQSLRPHFRLNTILPRNI